MNGCHIVHNLYRRFYKCLTETDSLQQPLFPEKQGVKSSLIGDWKVISILVFCVLQVWNMLQQLMMSCRVKKTQFLWREVNKQEQRRELNKKSKKWGVYSQTTGCLCQHAHPREQFKNLILTRSTHRYTAPLPLTGFITVMHLDN